jgi:multidrug efflux system membrane fusion protein
MMNHFARSPLILLALAAACSEKALPPVPPVPVTVGSAERRAVPFELQATGTVEPLQTVSIQSQVNGPIVRIAFREGQEVQKGQVLFQIDPRPYEAALRQAEALLARDRAQSANAEEEASRYEALAAKEYVTAQQYSQARTSAAATKATLAGSQAAVDEARLNLQNATIRAPISGRTGSLMVREGNLVRSAAATPLVTINQIRPILVRFAVPASNLGPIQEYRSKGEVTVHVEPTSGGKGSDGVLSFLDNAVDTTTGTILLKATFANEAGILWPGEFVNARIRLYTVADALVVPATAVVSGQQGSYVFVVQPDSTAATTPVKVERTAGELAVISGALEPGARVVTDGQLRLRPGAKVLIKGADNREQQGAK